MYNTQSGPPGNAFQHSHVAIFYYSNCSIVEETDVVVKPQNFELKGEYETSMSKTVLRRSLKEKEAKQLLLDFSQRLSTDVKNLFGDKPRVEMAESQGVEIIFVDGKPLLAKLQSVLVPTLTFDAALALFPKIVVNMGAVPYVCNGADVMAPGIVRIEGDFKKGDFAVIVDEKHGKSLCIGTSLLDSQTMRVLKQGKVVKNNHYVGDKLWNFIKKKT